MRHHARTLAAFGLAIFGIIIILGGAFGVQLTQAQDGPPTPKPEEPRELSLPMAHMLADRIPPEELASQTLTPCVGGMAGSYPCDNVDLLAFLSLGSMGGGSGNDIWGWTDPLDGSEYAIMGRTTGTSFVDISDPENPIYLGNLPPQTSNSTWRDIKVYANHAYIVSEASNSGMQIFDLTELRSVVSPPVTFSNTAHYSGFGSSHNIVINEDSGYAYAVGGTCSGGLYMMDISNPISPSFAGCYSADGYTHDAQCVLYSGPDTDHQGSEICFNSNEDTLTIVDVTDKNNPVQLAREGYSGSGYTHQGWITDDHAHFLLGDELDELNSGHNTRTYIWDITDLDNPVVDGNNTGAVAATDHNLYIVGDYAFEANYNSGLRILDISDVANTNLSEVAYFDIFPTNNNAGFNGAWSVYPFFDSGVVIVSGIEQGLFVLRPHLASDFTLSVNPASQAVCSPNDAVYTVDIGSISGYTIPVTLTLQDAPAGSNHGFSANPVVPPTTSTLTISNTAGVTPASYNMSVVGMSPTQTHTATVGLEVQAGVPGSTTLLSPADGASQLSLTPELTWSVVSSADHYYLEIATDMAFSNVSYTATTTLENHTVQTNQSPSTTYYWRVTAQNPCGSSSPSITYSYTTGDLYCSTPTLDIPDDGSGSAVDTISILATGEITDIDLYINATHTWVGDLDFTLEHQPSGTSIVAVDRPGVPASTFGCSGNDYDATIDDEAADPVEFECGAGTPAIVGSFYGGDPPDNTLLASFDGEDLSGDWILTITDNAGGDTGTLNEWCIQPSVKAELSELYMPVVVRQDP